jgi:hypothetical protein
VQDAPARTSQAATAAARPSESAAPRVIQASDLANDVCDLDCQNSVVDEF